MSSNVTFQPSQSASHEVKPSPTDKRDDTSTVKKVLSAVVNFFKGIWRYYRGSTTLSDR